LNTFVVHMPPLRERKEEIPLLMKHFVTQLSEHLSISPMSLTPAIFAGCQEHSWPGNIRELENFVKRLLVLRNEELAISELSTLNKENASVNMLPVKTTPVDLKQDFPISGDLKTLTRS